MALRLGAAAPSPHRGAAENPTRNRAATVGLAGVAVVLVVVALFFRQSGNDEAPVAARAGEAPSASSPRADVVYNEDAVDRPARPVEGLVAPRYPELLKGAGIEGEVLAQFIVDTLGVPVVSTFKVLTSAHDLFSLSVKNALPRMRFVPAEKGGRKVRQRVVQPFVFAVEK